MKNIGLSDIDNVRIGRHITLEVDASTQENAESLVDTACKKLLANQIMEGYHFTLTAK